jgi:hypothetical protein
MRFPCPKDCGGLLAYRFGGHETVGGFVLTRCTHCNTGAKVTILSVTREAGSAYPVLHVDIQDDQGRDPEDSAEAMVRGINAHAILVNGLRAIAGGVHESLKGKCIEKCAVCTAIETLRASGVGPS